MEQEACAILNDVLGDGDATSVEPPENFATAFREHFQDFFREFGDVELPIPPRGSPPEKLGTAINEIFRLFGIGELPIPPREPPREPPRFD